MNASIAETLALENDSVAKAETEQDIANTTHKIKITTLFILSNSSNFAVVVLFSLEEQSNGDGSSFPQSMFKTENRDRFHD